MKKFVKILFCLSLIFSVLTFSSVVYFNETVSDNIYVTSGNKIELNTVLNLKTKQTNLTTNSKAYGNSTSVAKLSIAGIIPVKNVNINEVNQTNVVVLGTPFGMKIYSDGVMVIGMSDVDTKIGKVNPSQIAGIRNGDIILTADGVKLSSNEQLADIVNSSNGQKIKLNLRREDKNLSVTVTPQFCETDNTYKIGLWVRDSSAGIGMLTFFDPNTNTLAGLGHGICDADTGNLIPINNGQALDAQILSVNKGTTEQTGELRGCFGSKILGELLLNDITGVYSTCDTTVTGEIMPIALKSEVKKGTAQILTTVDGTTPKLYECSIERINSESDSKIKNLVIKITDNELIEKTGGIVQGVSGSPIIQNGKLIGAVTHVLVDDPTKGYGIFAENMLETANAVGTGVLDCPQEEQLKKAS